MVADEFGMFDSVRLKSDLYGDDIYGGEVRLRKSKGGCVLELGKEPGTVIVEFQIGRGMKSMDFTAVEIEAERLEIVSKVGSRFSEPSPYLEKALAIKNQVPAK